MEMNYTTRLRYQNLGKSLLQGNIPMPDARKMVLDRKRALDKAEREDAPRPDMSPVQGYHGTHPGTGGQGEVYN